MNGKSNFFDKVLLSVASITLLASSYVLVDDRWLFQAASSGRAVLIGEFASSVNDVRRKLNENFVWLPANVQDTVFEGDSVFTGAESEAMVKLKDGTEIGISPNSLVVIRTVGNQASLDLQFGDVIGKLKSKNSQLIVSTGKKKTVLKGSKAEVSISKKKVGGTRLRVVKGNVQIASDKVKKSLKKNQSIDFKKSGKVEKIRQASIDLIEPEFGSLIGQKENIEFKWSNIEKKDKFIVEVSTGKSFKDILVKKFSDSPSMRVPNLPINQLLFWRVRAVNSDKKIIAASFASSFRLFSTSPPKPISPSEESEHIIAANHLGEITERQNIYFSWKPTNNSKYFNLQIADREDFKKILVNEKLKTSQFEFAAKAPGVFYWRVRSIGQQATNFSQPRAFKIQIQQEEAPLVAPKLSEEDIQYTKGSDQSLTLSWEAAENAHGYFIEFSLDEDFSKQIHTAKTESNEYSWESPQVGKVYWRVSALNKEGEAGPGSIGQLSIEGKQPDAPKTNIFQAKVTPGVTNQINWDKVEGAESYEIEVSTDADFKKDIQLLKSDSNSIDYSSPKLGAHFFRIRAISEDGVSSPWSDISEFEIIKATLEPVKFAQDILSHVILPYERVPSAKGPTIEWVGSPAADSYILEISKSKNFSKVLLSKKLKSTKYTWKKYVWGKAFVRVKSVGKDGRQSAFTILPLKLSFPNPPMTKFRSNVDELMDEYETFKVDVKWKKVEFANSYKLRIGNDKKLKGAKEYTTSSLSKNFKFRKAKVYYWQVQPLDARKQPMGSFSSIQKLDLNLSKGLLAAPELSLPEKNSTLFFQDTRFVKFTWSKVRKADSYDLQVATDSDFKNNVIEKTVKSTKEFWQGDIDNSTYYWRVRSVNRRYKSRWSTPFRFSVTGP